LNNGVAGSLKMAVYDYAGTGGGTGAAYIAGSIGTGSGPVIPGLTFHNTETYALSLTTHLITAAEDAANAGKVRVTFSVTDPDRSPDPGLLPFTASVTGVSVGLASLQSGGGEQFGLYVNSSGSAYTGNFDNFNVVPEPSSVALLAFSLVGLAVAGSRKWF
jgi:hypothetical protein